jgi:chromosome segregation ATPase
MNRDDSIQEVIAEVIAIHKELADDAHAIGVHRKELGSRVDVINKRYLKLFERVMSEILAMQRTKFAAIAEELERMREAAEELLEKYLTEKARRERLEAHVAELSQQNEKLKSVIRAKDLEMAMMSSRISELETSEQAYHAYLEDLKRDREKLERDRLSLEAKIKVCYFVC